MARIPQNFLDDLLARTDIVQLIDGRVPLKRQGSEYAACCPFHDEKSPSFTVSPTKQFYHCFGCGAHGTAISFLMEYDRLEFRDAVDELAKLAGVEVPVDAADSGPRIDPRIWEALTTAQQIFARALRGSPKAIDYLKGRGLDGQTAKRFGIGYAPDAWQTVTDAVGDSRIATQAGLAIRKDDGRAYDRFRDRVTFPIHDLRGRVVGFGGRAFGDEKPKYLNSPETPVFHKGNQLYGLYEARQANKTLEHLLVVEGYMDVVALSQFGIHCAVATLGTATTTEHINLMFRSTSRIVLCFDGDRAGREAGWRAVERALPAMRDGREIRLLFLPDGEDPDTLVRKEGAEAFNTRVAQAEPLSQFLLDQLTEQVDLSSVDGRARLVALATPHLEALAPGAFRKGLEQQVSQIVGFDIHDMTAVAPPPPPRAPGPTPDTGAAEFEAPTLTPRLRRAARALLEQPALAAELPEIPRLADDPGQQFLEQLLHAFAANPQLTAAQYAERLRGEPDEATLDDVLAGPPFPPGFDAAADFREVLKRIVADNAKQRVQTLMQLAQERELTQAERDELRAGYQRG